MNAAEFDALLRQFLVDGRFSKHEREVLVEYIAKTVTTEQHRGKARHLLFETARQAVTDAGAVQVLGFVEDVLRILVPMPSSGSGSGVETPDVAAFSPGEACLAMILSRFANARRSVDVCVFTITDNRITKSIIDTHRRGVKVRIITDNDKANDDGSDIAEIEAAGIPVRTDRTEYHMHHKFAIFDRTRLLNGSYNWTRSAAMVNEENIIDTGDAGLIASFQKEFDGLWERLG